MSFTIEKLETTKAVQKETGCTQHREETVTFWDRVIDHCSALEEQDRLSVSGERQKNEINAHVQFIILKNSTNLKKSKNNKTSKNKRCALSISLFRR